MFMRPPQTSSRDDWPVWQLSVYRSQGVRAVEGVNEGDPLTDATELVHEDVYALAPGAVPLRLGLIVPGAPGPFRVARLSDAGRAGAAVHLDCRLIFMASDRARLDALVLVELDAAGLIAEVYLCPLSPPDRSRTYTLVTIDRDVSARLVVPFAKLFASDRSRRTSDRANPKSHASALLTPAARG